MSDVGTSSEIMHITGKPEFWGGIGTGIAGFFAAWFRRDSQKRQKDLLDVLDAIKAEHLETRRLVHEIAVAIEKNQMEIIRSLTVLLDRNKRIDSL